MSSRIFRSWSVSGASALSCGGPWRSRSSTCVGDGRVEQRLAGGDPAHRVDQVVAADLLEHVAGGAGHDRGEQRLVVVVRREDQGRDLRVAGPDVAADVDAGAVGQPAVEDRDVRTQRGDAPAGLLGQAGLADHLDVALGLEQVPQPAPDHLVVVEQEDPDRVLRGGGVRRLGHRTCVPERRARRARPNAPDVGTLDSLAPRGAFAHAGPMNSTQPDLAAAVDLARLAPSVHNTQPWRFGIGGRRSPSAVTLTVASRRSTRPGGSR